MTTGVGGQARELYDGIRGRYVPKLNRNTAFLLGLAMLIVTFAEVFRLLNGTERPKTLLDVIAPKDKDGNRWMLNTHLKDWVHILHKPLEFVRNSLTGAIGKEFDIWNNKDFYGTQVYNPDDNIVKQELDKAIYRFPTPFTVSTQKKLADGKSSVGTRAGAALGFIQPTPKYMSNTPAMTLASEIVNKNMQREAITKEDFAKQQDIRKVRDEFVESGDRKILVQAVRDGRINGRQMSNIIRQAKLTPFERMLTGMDYHQIQTIIEHGDPNPEEMDALRDAYKKKINSKLNSSQNSFELEQHKRAKAKFIAKHGEL
jgi:hypothetical protein